MAPKPGISATDTFTPIIGSLFVSVTIPVTTIFSCAKTKPENPSNNKHVNKKCFIILYVFIIIIPLKQSYVYDDY